MRRRPLVPLTAVVVTAGIAALPSAGGAQGSPGPCSYSKAHPAPVRVGDLPAAVVPGRTEVVRVVPRTTSAGRLADKNLTALSISFEQITDATETFRADMLASYKKTKAAGRNIGYDVTLDADSPGERGVVRWSDADPSLPGQPCTAEIKTRDMKVVTSRPQTPKVGATSGASDVRAGDSATLTIGGKGRGCPLTDPSALTVTATSRGAKKTLKLDMACGFWASAGATVKGFRLLSEDGDYKGAAKLFVSPRNNPKAGSKLTVVVRKGKKVIATKRFTAKKAGARVKVVAV